MAAIASPTSLLNELIDEAAGYMSNGVTFGSRESLKKSLTVARKSAENGGFKLKCYKNSDTSATRNALNANTPATNNHNATNSAAASLTTNKFNNMTQAAAHKQNEKIADLVCKIFYKKLDWAKK